jgi:4-hydroxy-3-polyprenylbenzoate decarboxylase
LETDVEANPDLDITGVQKHLDGSCPILFNNLKGYPHLRAVTNLFANASVMNRVFGWPNDSERTKVLAHALCHPISPVEIGQDEAPVQQHVITDDLDVNKWVLAGQVLQGWISCGLQPNELQVGQCGHFSVRTGLPHVAGDGGAL